MTTLRKTQTTDFVGVELGLNFNDGTIIPNINTAAITRIILTADSYHLRSITVRYIQSTFIKHLLISVSEGPLCRFRGSNPR